MKMNMNTVANLIKLWIKKEGRLVIFFSAKGAAILILFRESQ